MYKKYLYIIPLFLLEVMVQLGFFWLAPARECKWVVYAFLTTMTVAHLVIIFVLMTQYGTRRAASIIVAGSFIQTMIIGATVLLLAVKATVRSASFLMLMLMALYTAVVAILWITIEGFGENNHNMPNIDDNEQRDNYEPYRENECRDYSEGIRQRADVPPVRDNYYGVHNAERYNDRSSVRRTPPPIPVRH